MVFKRAWRHLRYFLKCMASVFGDPSRMAADDTISASRRVEILNFLRPLERFARLILLAESARQSAAKSAPPRRPRTRRFKRVRREIPESSADWRVSFSAMPSARKQARRAPTRVRPKFMAELPTDPVPLAARFEALIRVALDPDAYVRRLVRRLDRRGLSRRTARRLLRPLAPNAPPMQHPLKHILPFAERARARFRDTS